MVERQLVMFHEDMHFFFFLTFCEEFLKTTVHQNQRYRISK